MHELVLKKYNTIPTLQMIGSIRTNYLHQACRIRGIVYNHVTEQCDWSMREPDTQSYEVKAWVLESDCLNS